MENDKNTNTKRNEIKDLRVKRTLENINNAFNELIFETDCEKIGEYRYNLLIAFVQSTTLSMYKQWITDGKKISLEEIISLTSDLLIDGMKKFF